MRQELDQELRGYVRQFFGPKEIVDYAVKEMTALGTDVMPGGGGSYSKLWVGRSFSSWEDFRQKFFQPWEEGVKKVEAMLEELRWEHMTPPASLRRRPNWNDCSGSVSVDRAISGEMNFMRRMKRKQATGPQNIAVLCNIGNLGYVTADEIFWRGAAAIAAIDLLEDAGYGCEVWVYNLAWGTCSYPNDKTFICCKVKESGAPMDLEMVVNTLSAWFFRCCVMQIRKTLPYYRGSGSSQRDCGKWRKYMDVTNDIREVKMPMVTDREEAIEAAKGVLAQVTAKEEVID